MNFYGKRYMPEQPYAPNDMIQRRNLHVMKSAPNLRPMQRDSLLEPMYWDRDPGLLPPVNNPVQVDRDKEYGSYGLKGDFMSGIHESQRRMMRGDGRDGYRADRPAFRPSYNNYPDYGPDRLSQFGREY